MTNLVINVPSEYVSLGLVMQSAMEQASKGKGRERHASEGEAYEDQIICEVARRVGLGYPLGQAVKKIYESQRIGGERGVAELLGAINYIAAAVIVMREGLETAPKAEGGCCQNGNDQPEELELKHGDAVEWNSVGRGWLPAVYLREFGDFGHCAIQIDGRERIVCKVDLRRSEANYPENPDSSTATQPKFQPGDSLLVTMPEGEDVPCVYVGESERPGCCIVRYLGGDYSGDTDDTVPIDQLRRVPVSKAEGCEDLVQDKEESDVERVFGTLKKRPAPEFDAPQTAQELHKRIIANNPATYGTPHKPTGEELAEMAREEDADGGA